MTARYIFVSLTGIVICGTIGAVAAWALVTSIGLDGVSGALAAIVAALVIAVAAWVALTTLWRAVVGPR